MEMYQIVSLIIFVVVLVIVLLIAIGSGDLLDSIADKLGVGAFRELFP